MYVCIYLLLTLTSIFMQIFLPLNVGLHWYLAVVKWTDLIGGQT